METIGSNIRLPWMIIGDFNSVLFAHERSNGNNFVSCNNKFYQWFSATGLIDLGYSGQSFTWKHGGSLRSSKGARLDRAVCNTAWRLKFV